MNDKMLKDLFDDSWRDIFELMEQLAARKNDVNTRRLECDVCTKHCSAYIDLLNIENDCCRKRIATKLNGKK
jgi:hypothetical protein